MKQLDEELTAYPEERAKFNEYLDRANERRGQSYGQVNEVQKASADASKPVSVAAREDTLDSKPFASVSSLTPEYNAAALPASGKSVTPQVATPSPQLAVAQPQPTVPKGTGGLDMS